jgi:hypothetical protein
MPTQALHLDAKCKAASKYSNPSPPSLLDEHAHVFSNHIMLQSNVIALHLYELANKNVKRPSHEKDNTNTLAEKTKNSRDERNLNSETSRMLP